MNHRVRLLLVYLVPPLLVGVLIVALYLAIEEVRSPGPVQILDAGVVVGWGTQAEAIEYVSSRIGMKPVFPTILPHGGYELSVVNVLEAPPPAEGYGVLFTYDRQDGAPAWFWVNQIAANSQFIPEGLPEVETAVEGAMIWTLGEPSKEYVEATGQGFQFIARTAKYDRIVSFEGAYRPDMPQARLVIESMLRQD